MLEKLRNWLHLRSQGPSKSIHRGASPSTACSTMAVASFSKVDIFLNADAMALHKQALKCMADAQCTQAKLMATNLLAQGLNAYSWHIEGWLQAAEGCYENALSEFERAIDAIPSNGLFYRDAGDMAMRLGRLDDAEYFLEQAAHYDKQDSSARELLGELFLLRKQTREAMQHFTLALAINPYASALRKRLAQMVWNRGKVQGAVELYLQGLQLAPHDMDWHQLLFECYQAMGATQLAKFHAEQSLALNPNSVAAQLNMAYFLDSEGDISGAYQQVEGALHRDPTDPFIHWAYAQFLLKDGRFAEAWPHYEQGLGLRTRNNRYGISRRPWRDESLVGKRVLVYGEQGLGDEILFASCIPDVMTQATYSIIQCAPKLQKLFSYSFPGALVRSMHMGESTAWLDEVGGVDYEIPSGTLPSVFRLTNKDFPTTPYLKVPEKHIHKWRDRLQALGPGLKVGISWRGGTISTGELIRSIDLHEWGPILNTAGVHIVNLQYTRCADEVQHVKSELGVSVVTWQDALDDYLETAALICALDLVISVCTSVVALASGLGKPVWVMAPPGGASWRYIRGQRHTPWAPTAEIFWQEGKTWPPTIQQVADELAQTAREYPKTISPDS